MMHWQILGPDGRVVREADQPCHNIVLNNAKELVATLGLFEQSNWAVVGTGSTAPAPTQTGLANEIARTNQTVSGNPDTVTEVSTGVWEITRYRQFTAAQVGNQNLTEWGFSGSGTPGNNLMCRELFRDGSNNPVTLTLDADQQLRLIYKVRVTVGPTTPQAASINITNLGVRTGQLILFRNNATSNLNPVDSLSTMARGMDGSYIAYNPSVISLNYNDPSGPFLSGGLGFFPASWQPYVSNSKKRTQNPQTRTTNEVVGTIRGIGLSDITGVGLYYYRVRLYFQFDSGQEIIKDNLHELTISGFEVQWT
ncbi:MAG: hypothetical protein RML14_01525 [Meiothermus sp.]|uniref:hypothetical protein n=1 Tax=Meiothermus sp. TaxID=1955249 RepID=UPI00298F2F98|nr:hypothetical protein [Meiothermus sp.]MCS6783393.1 hypothetical protein [Gloeomargarita sp. SKYG98]MDW8480593.1 hypothetical protein [Meiothermus sp.]